jgi:hypothetical protein
MRCIAHRAYSPPCTSFVVVSGKDVDGRPSPAMTITGLIQRGSAVRQVWNAP